MTQLDDQPTTRAARTKAPLHPLLAQRWSPRAYDPATELSEATVVGLLEAARWAPSRSNGQKRRFLVGLRGDPTFHGLHAALKERNQEWAGHAGALIAGIVPLDETDGTPDRLSAYDLGLAVAQLSLQAQAEGLRARQMAGFEPAEVHRRFDVPADHVALVVIAVGVQGRLEDLSESLQQKELAPRERLPLSEIALAGRWQQPWPPAL